MEVRNTPPEPDLTWLDTADLINKLMFALVDAAKAGSPKGVFTRIQSIHGILISRKADFTAELESFSHQTGWRLAEFLQECLAWPDVTPQVQDADGIRAGLRCWSCQTREYPEAAFPRICDGCLIELIELLKKRTPPKGVLFFRIYNESYWCPHADAETVLMTPGEWESLEEGQCEQCLREELARRKTVTTQA